MNDYVSHDIQAVAVLGAGVMGAQIAAHCANAGFKVILFDLPTIKGDINSIANNAISNLSLLKPSPLSLAAKSNCIQPANYQSDLSLLESCDLVIEAISERLDWKHELYEKIIPFLKESVILASNTSGISIESLSCVLPSTLTKRFCGVHFFNPPRYMTLVELIPHKNTDKSVINLLESWLTTSLGKNIIHAKDTPGFIGNRVGIFSLLSIFHHAQRLGLSPDVVDKLTGPMIGRPKSGSYRTADVIGLDTLNHITTHFATELDDPWSKYYKLPMWMLQLIEVGQLGQKTRAGVFKKIGKSICVFDSNTKEYTQSAVVIDQQVNDALKEKNWHKKFTALQSIDHPQAEFILSILLDLFHYCSVMLIDIAHCARDIDLTMRWGFGWSEGPFETWQTIGWNTVIDSIEQRIKAGDTLSSAPLPEWVNMIDQIHTPMGSWSASQSMMLGRSNNPVYNRQTFPQQVIGEKRRTTYTLFENADMQLWHTGDDIGIISFNTKMHIATQAALEGLQESLTIAADRCKGLVIWQEQAPFCAGVNLQQVLSQTQDGRLDDVRQFIRLFQETTMKIKHSPLPIVAACTGYALGGGCEILLHCDKVVAHLESKIGLVEVNVGLIPAAGGCKEIVLRSKQETDGHDTSESIKFYFDHVSKASISSSAHEAQAMHYLCDTDDVIHHSDEILSFAKLEALSLFESGYKPPIQGQEIAIPGQPLLNELIGLLSVQYDRGELTDHGYLILSKLAEVLCGGSLPEGTLKNDRWFLDLELNTFMDLLETDSSQSRINYMLKNNKPLIN